MSWTNLLLYALWSSDNFTTVASGSVSSVHYIKSSSHCFHRCPCLLYRIVFYWTRVAWHVSEVLYFCLWDCRRHRIGPSLSSIQSSVCCCRCCCCTVVVAVVRQRMNYDMHMGQNPLSQTAAVAVSSSTISNVTKLRIFHRIPCHLQ